MWFLLVPSHPRHSTMERIDIYLPIWIQAYWYLNISNLGGIADPVVELLLPASSPLVREPQTDTMCPPFHHKNNGHISPSSLDNPPLRKSGSRHVVHDVPSVCGTKSGAAKLELLCWPPAATAVHPVTLLELDHFGEVGKLRRDVDRL